MKQGIWAILALSSLTIPAHAAETPKRVYHDCRPSQDIVRGRAVWKTICQNQDGDWVEVPPEPRKPTSVPASAVQRPLKRPIYHDCRSSQDIVQGRAVWKRVCQNENGDWVEMAPLMEKARP